MDATHFDRLARALSEVSTRRGLLGLLATLPLLGGLVALLDRDDGNAKGRRKRRKKPHHHRKKSGNRAGNTKKRRCKPESPTKTCEGKCGSVKNNCQKTVECGSCDCDPACQECFTCQGEPGAPGSCVPQSANTPCGAASFCREGTRFPQGSCDGDGNCLSSTERPCDPYTKCDGDRCASTCDTDDDCVAGSFCDAEHHCIGDGDAGAPCGHAGQCASGFCTNGVCCKTACAGACQVCDASGDGTCTTVVDGTGCGSGNICCNGSCQECCDRDDCSGTKPVCVSGACASCSADPDGCPDGACCNASSGACVEACPANAPICAGTNICTACSQQNPCPGGKICCNGECFAGICCEDGDCTAAVAPDCFDHSCTCDGGAACAGDPELCCDGECVDTDTSQSHCGRCANACTGATPICAGGVCVACSDQHPCPSGCCEASGACVPSGGFCGSSGVCLRNGTCITGCAGIPNSTCMLGTDACPGTCASDDCCAYTITGGLFCSPSGPSSIPCTGGATADCPIGYFCRSDGFCVLTCLG
jgi:hypothetical protein